LIWARLVCGWFCLGCFVIWTESLISRVIYYYDLLLCVSYSLILIFIQTDHHSLPSHSLSTPSTYSLAHLSGCLSSFLIWMSTSWKSRYSAEQIQYTANYRAQHDQDYANYQLLMWINSWLGICSMLFKSVWLRKEQGLDLRLALGVVMWFLWWSWWSCWIVWVFIWRRLPFRLKFNYTMN